MKKRNYWRAAFSLLLALVMCLSLPLSVMAEEGTVSVETTGGNPETVNVNIVIEQTTQPDGSIQTNTTEVANGQVTASGMIVDYSGQSSMTTAPDGTTTGTASSQYQVNGGAYGAMGGSETILSTQAPEASVEVPLTTDAPDNTNTGNGAPAGTSDITGEKPENGEGTYDYTTTTIHQQGSVTVTTNSITAEEKIGAEGTDLSYVHSQTSASSDNDLFTSDLYEGNPTAADPNNVPQDMIPDAVEGYDYNLITTGNSSQFYAGFLYKTPGYEGEQPAYVAKDGTPYYAHRTDLGNSHKLEGVFLNGKQDAGTDTVYKAVWANVAQYILVDAETGELITTYCADLTTQTQDGYGYNIQNVEDASYYIEEQAAMIRTIAQNGYWGVQDDAATEAAEFGSLESMKQMMEKAVDAKGRRIFTDEEVAALTDGMAMSATQYAIWTFSNEMENIQILNSQYISKDENNMGKGWSYSHLKNIPEDEQASVALIFKLYDYLINMEPSETTGTTADTIINADNFLQSMEVTVVKKAEDHANNADNNHENDAYVTDLSFALVVTPSTENGDDLTVKVLDSEGNVIASGRIAGEAKNGETVLTADAKGNYTFSNITLIEGNQNFNITLEGVQNLDAGVYLYTSEIRDDVSSQTMVGLAEGERAVSVSLDIEFELNVKDEVVATEHVWRTEWTNPGGGGGTFRLRRNPKAENDDTVEILDEEVPLADAPKTGDGSLILAAISALSGIGYAGLTFTTRRKEQ